MRKLNMAHPPNEQSMAELMSELAADVSTLMRKELELARLELSTTASRVIARLSVILVSLAVVSAGLYALVAALVLAAIELGLRPSVAALLVGLLLAIVGGAVAMGAFAALRREELAPKESIRSLKETVEWAKQHAMHPGASGTR